MQSSERRRRGLQAALLIAFAWTARADAQQAAQGFALERLYRSAPGAGWFVMDTLDMRGGLGGVAGLTIGYAQSPLRVTDNSHDLEVVSHQAFANIGFAATSGPLRVYVNFDVPLVLKGDTGSIAGYDFTAPSVDLSSHPDTIYDPRIGLDARLVGEASSPFRLGAGAQLYIPSGNRADYNTDGTYRAMGRFLVAGDTGRLSYAGHVGVHVRPLDDAPSPGSPHGSELLFGAAAGVRVATVGDRAALVLGPELYGATAFRSIFGATTTALEGLLTARIEGTGDGAQLRGQFGIGAGLDPHFGAPAWRLVLNVEVFANDTRR